MAQMTISRRGVLLGAVLVGSNAPSRAAANEGFDKRRLKVYQLRERRATYHALQHFPAPQDNKDEAKVANYAAMFAKTLPHNDLGEPEKPAYEALLSAIRSGTPEAFELVPGGGPGRLVNPLGAFAYELEGADPQQFTCPPPPAFDSAPYAAETVELYWQSLARDVPFHEYGSSHIIQQAATELSALTAFQGPKIGGKVTADVIFRGVTQGDVVGPYISQFALKDVPYGTTPFAQIYRTAESGIDYATTFSECLNLQRGMPPSAPIRFAAARRHILTGRDLALFVWQDFTYQIFLNAALILNGMGAAAMKETNPYRGLRRQAGFTTFGGPMILDLVARAANSALRAIWYQKWAIHRRLRPEAVGARVHNIRTRQADYPLHRDLVGSQAVERTFEKFGTYLLPQAYPEGAPAHPSFAAGHAGIAGACTTMLKAFFQGSAEVPNPVVPNSDGSALVPYAGPALTIGGELDKLASNVGIGRHWAGIHYLSDAVESMRIGEQVAIGILGDLVDTCPEEFSGFHLTMFDGSEIEITG